MIRPGNGWTALPGDWQAAGRRRWGYGRTEVAAAIAECGLPTEDASFLHRHDAPASLRRTRRRTRFNGQRTL
ncbi:hypothetical protein FHR56_002946 [Xanthomonas sacchari]|nr:hypothetical protein [Xanthomonas sp. F10]